MDGRARGREGERMRMPKLTIWPSVVWGTVMLAVSAAVWLRAQAAGPASNPAVNPLPKPSPISAPAPMSAPMPAPAPMPAWPVNESPAQAVVQWDSHGLRISAKNASLRQILTDVAARTGAKLEGIGTDERVFGEYGPGPAREVLAELLHGSAYNVMLVGDQGQGTPRQILLSPRPAAAGNQAHGTQPTHVEEDPEPEPEDQPVQQPPLPRPPITPPGNPPPPNPPPPNQPQE